MRSSWSRLVAWLRSARLALAVLAFLAAWTALGGFGPWAGKGARPGEVVPAWASAAGLDRPFASWPFFAALALLFASTAACALPRLPRCLALLRGELPPEAATLRARAGADLAAFLRARGFRGEGPVLVRFRAGLLGGWVLHLGLLAIMAAAAVQQAFHDEGRFRLADGDAVRLRAPGVVFAREGGPLAPGEPPDLEVTLAAFDAFQHQRGYSPDRRSRVAVRAGARAGEALLDRAAGFSFGGAELYQAIPSGLALRLQWPDGAYTVLQLLEVAERRSEIAVDDPLVGRGRFVAETERDAHDPRGTGRVEVRFERAGGGPPVVGDAMLGPSGARMAGVGRWGEYKYSRDPGIAAVFAGFALLLVGSALLALPAAVARLDGEGGGRVLAARGAALLREEWEAGARAGDDA